MDEIGSVWEFKLGFATLSVALGSLATIPYIVSILNGHRPPYSTYLGWLLIGVTGFIFHYQAISAEDDKWSAFLPALYILIPLTYLLLLAFLRAQWKLDTRDKASLIGIVVCWVVWVASHLSGLSHPIVPLVALVTTDAFASWPLLQDASRGEESKPMNVASWTLTLGSVACGVVAVADPWSAEMVYPGYLLVMMGGIWLCSMFNFLRKGEASIE